MCHESTRQREDVRGIAAARGRGGRLPSARRLPARRNAMRGEGEGRRRGEGPGCPNGMSGEGEERRRRGSGRGRARCSRGEPPIRGEGA